MKLLWPARSVSIFFVIALGLALIHLFTRVYLPLPLDERKLPEFSAELRLSSTDTDAPLVAMLKKYTAPPVDMREPASVQFDGRKLGEHYVELFGIYKAGGNYKAILSIQSGSAKDKQIIRLGLQEEHTGLRLTEIKARHITIEFEKQSVTLQLFRSEQQGSVLTH